MIVRFCIVFYPCADVRTDTEYNLIEKKKNTISYQSLFFQYNGLFSEQKKKSRQIHTKVSPLLDAWKNECKLERCFETRDQPGLVEQDGYCMTGRPRRSY